MDPIIQLIHRAAQDKEFELRREMDNRSRNGERLSQDYKPVVSHCAAKARGKLGQVRVSWSNPFNRRPTHEIC